MQKRSLRQRFVGKLQKMSARRALGVLATEVQRRAFSVVIKRVPGVLRKQRRILFERSSPDEVRSIERLLKSAHPELNRKERRHLARKHRYLFHEHLAI